MHVCATVFLRTGSFIHTVGSYWLILKIELLACRYVVYSFEFLLSSLCFS